MTFQTQARLIAAIALPLLALNVSQARAAPAPGAAPQTAPCITPVSPESMAHISVYDIGKRDGPVVVLIPGLSSPRDVWNGIVPDLEKTHRLLIVQVNGFGGDDPGANLKPGILNGVVADLDAYIVKNKLKGAAVIGHSMGGLIGMMLAKAHPGDIGKLMIVDSLPFFGMLFGAAATTAMVQPQAAAMRDQMIATYGKPADPAAADGIATSLALKPASRATVKAWVMAADPRVSGEAMYEDLQTDLRADMASIQTPMTIVYPWNDARPTKPMADALYKGAYAAAPHMTYVDIGDAAHFVMLDQPEAFAKAVAAFLGG